jgi:hypothetical protein
MEKNGTPLFTDGKLRIAQLQFVVFGSDFIAGRVGELL